MTRKQLKAMRESLTESALRSIQEAHEAIAAKDETAANSSVVVASILDALIGAIKAAENVTPDDPDPAAAARSVIDRKLRLKVVDTKADGEAA